MTTLRRLLPMLLLLALAGVQAGDPPEKTRKLTDAEQKEVAQLKAQVNRHLGAGQFEQAAKVAKQIADYRTERQGAAYWQAIDARLEVERLQRLTAGAGEGPQGGGAGAGAVSGRRRTAAR